MTDNIVIVLTHVTDETVLAILSALQAFEKSLIQKNDAWNQVHHVDRKLDLSLFLVVVEDRYNFIFQKCLTHLKKIYLVGDPVENIDLHYVCKLDIKEAEALAAPTRKPLALALGILLGAEAGTLPDVTGIVPFTAVSHKLLLDERLLHLFPCVDVVDNTYADGMSLDQKIEWVQRSAVVVGYSSFETYLACCLRKPVLEVQFNSALYKWDNKQYYTITEADMIKDLLPKGIDLCMRQAR